MGLDLRVNTAVDVLIGPFVDSTDGNTTEDGLTLSQADIKLSKNGQALTQKNDATAAAFDDDGYYNCELDSTDTNTEGNLVLIVHESGALPVRHEFNVMSEAAWDSLYVAKDDGFMDVNIKTVGRVDTQETEANNLESACSNYSAARGLTGTALPAAAADAAGGLPISDAGGLDLDTQLANTNEVTAARMGALTDWINGGRLDLILDIIAADTTTDIPTLLATIDTNVDSILTGTPMTKYMGYYGPGIYIDSGAANENTVVGTDGTVDNPVSTFAAARTIADAIGLNRYYLEGNSDITLAATHVDWEFCGVGAVADNVMNFGSQDVSRSRFCNLTLEGTQGGADRIEAIECALQDPGAGATTLHIFALRCGLVNDVEIDTSNNNIFESCYSLVAGAATPSIIATGAAGTLEIRHYSGGIELKTLSASHNVSIEGMGQVVFNADCNVNANVSIRGLFTITDNTAGMASLTQDAVVNMPKINTECDAALTDIKLDHLINAAAAEDEVADNSIIARLAATEGDWSEFNDENHSLEAIRVRGDSAWVTATGFALASVLGALNDVAAAGDPTDADTLVQYIKQLLNVLIGTAGIAAFPAEAAPANAVSLAEVIRAIHVDTDSLAADVKTAIEADGSDLSSLMEALVNKRIWEEVNGNLEMFNDAGASQGTIAAQVATDGTYTTAKRALI